MEREQIITQVLSATSDEECRRAEVLIRNWMAVHPDDFGMLDAGEQLAMIFDATPESSLEAVVRKMDELQPA